MFLNPRGRIWVVGPGQKSQIHVCIRREGSLEEEHAAVGSGGHPLSWGSAWVHRCNPHFRVTHRVLCLVAPCRTPEMTPREDCSELY